MSSRYDINQFSIPLTVTALILIATLSVMPCTSADILSYSLAGQYLRIGWIVDNPYISKIGSLLLITVWPLMFFAMDRLYPLRLGPCLPLLYAVLIFSCRDALCLSPIHIAAFFLAWAVFYSFRASLEPYDADNPFLSMMMLSTASLFFAPLIWMAPLMAFLDNNNSAQKGKTIIGSVCGMLLPMLFAVGIHAIISNFTDILSPVVTYAGMVVRIDAGIPAIHQSATVLKVILLLVSVVWAVISFLTVFGTLDIAAERCHLHCLFYSVILSVIVLVFGKSIGSLAWMLILMPASLFLYAFFNKSTQKRAGVFLLSLLLLLIVAERIVVLI